MELQRGLGRNFNRSLVTWQHLPTAMMETTRQPTETISETYHDKYITNQSPSHDRNGGRRESVRSVVRRQPDGKRKRGHSWCSC